MVGVVVVGVMVVGVVADVCGAVLSCLYKFVLLLHRCHLIRARVCAIVIFSTNKKFLGFIYSKYESLLKFRFTIVLIKNAPYPAGPQHPYLRRK